MICDKCKKNIATTHIEQNIGGKVSKMDLCSECAASVETAIPMNFGGLLGSIFGDTLSLTPAVNEKQCGFCGSTFGDIVRTGRVGCANCYTEFYDKLLPTLHKLHGNTTHQGKRPGRASIQAETVDTTSEIDRLKAELAQAIEREEFEKAAKLRDEINALKERGEGHE